MWISSDILLAWSLPEGSFMTIRYKRDLLVASHVGQICNFLLNITGYSGPRIRWWPELWVYTRSNWKTLNGTFWLPILLLAMLALQVAVSASSRSWQWRRAKQGLCILCSYDLTGADHTLCPECGADVARSQ